MSRCIRGFIPGALRPGLQLSMACVGGPWHGARSGAPQTKETCAMFFVAARRTAPDHFFVKRPSAFVWRNEQRVGEADRCARVHNKLARHVDAGGCPKTKSELPAIAAHPFPALPTAPARSVPAHGQRGTHGLAI